ncbi:isochorismatase [Helicosporidium sp. ATCC 50920]|nr:isochorismatase [Helicosporidium sp. ATCC 50920]|eukprot:KDD75982.1 isochorismatase [Helicosporidium sp. ATCC 50920]
MSTSADVKRDVGRLQADEAVLFVCDVQERFRSMIHNFTAVVDTTNRLIRGAQLLDIPVIVTEQYPKALGRTVSELTSVLPPDTLSVDKTKFSMCIDPVWDALRQRPAVRSVLVTGIEAHVCVFQTCLDLLEKGYAVHVLSDAVSSKRPEDRSAALARLRDAGAWIVTSEMVLFQLMGNTSHPAFKNVSALVKEDRPPLLPPQ